MQTVAHNNFITVKTEGGILPADLLQRIANGDVAGLHPADYHLPANERLNEAINRSWNRLLGVWQAFQHKMEQAAPAETGTTMTRDWLLTVLQELGYGRLPYQGSISIRNPLSVNRNPTDHASRITDDASRLTDQYPISHLYDHTPIHLVSFRQGLDGRDHSQTIKRSPHSLVQECLNRSEAYLWGFVSNGLRFRILRDNISLSRAAYAEFDLEAMFQGELYADFSLFWLLCHQSRVETLPETSLPSDCWLERWSQTAVEQGTRALDALRDGVQEAISALGRGFLAHPANRPLRDDLQSGALTTQAYYRQLLRLVYRLLFLFVAEDRDLLLLPGRDVALQRLYDQYYSVSRLRRLAETRRGGPHPDLYHALTRLFGLLRGGYEPLALPGLGSFLFSARATPDLDAALLANQDLLTAVRALAFTTEGRVRRPVDYKNLGSEEFGSVYESLLELHPQMHLASAAFSLDVTAGSERKTTGSYYTHTSLIQSLLDSALEPVIADRLAKAGRGLRPFSPEWQAACEKALLALKVMDISAGSGHFLIAAARRLARHLARIWTGDDEPGPEMVRRALREVVSHCIYGVDINEMAVELCKVALWMETLDPGKPLSFLDGNIRCGNSLMGATPALLAQGIPDAAFTPITGDDKSYAAEWKKRNKQQRQGQLELFRGDMQPWERLGDLAAAMSRLERLADDTLAGVQAQEAEYARLVQSSDYEFGKLWADAWCAAFVWEKRPETAAGWAYPITEQVFRNLERSPYREPQWLKDEVRRLAAQYQFFHWHLEFPHIFTPREDLTGLDEGDVTGWQGGVDVVLGNPPWERIKLQEKEWFASRDEAIATAPNAAARRRLIAALPQTDPALHEAFAADKRQAEGESHFVRSSGRYPLCGRGDVNTYTLFAELARHVQSDTGRVGVIVPSGIATDDTTKYYFQDIMDSAALVSLYDFENRNAIFPGVHRSYKFCLLTLTGAESPAQAGAQFVFFALDVADLRDEERRFTLSAADIALLNPNTRTCPIFRGKQDAELTKAIYRRVPVLIKEGVGGGEVNPWGMRIRRVLDMNQPAILALCVAEYAGEHLPVYEAKLIHQFDHRLAIYSNSTTEYLTPATKGLAVTTINPRYWISLDDIHKRTGDFSPKKWLLCWRDICRNTDERTAISAVIPFSGTDFTLRIGFSEYSLPFFVSFLVTNFNFFGFDYFVRQMMGGTHLSDYILKQLPVLPPQTYHRPCPWLPNSSFLIHNFLLPRVLELTYTAYDLRPFAQDCGYSGPPFRWDTERRFLLRCELDAAYFHLYGIGREDVAYIMDTFPIVRRKDEAAHGEYRTKRVILEMYDDMAKAMDSGPPYQTRLDPPPAHPDAAHPWDAAFLGPELPREQWWAIEDNRALEDNQQPVEDPNRRGGTAGPAPGEKPERPFPAVSPPPAAPQTIQEPPPTFELQRPSAPQPKPKTKPTPSLAAQPAPGLTAIGDFSPPTGSRAQRLRTVMGLGQPKNQAELQALVGALADEDESIRWLAGSSLARLGGTAVVQMLAAFLRSQPGATAVQEARRVLELIADTDEDEAVRTAVQALTDTG